MTKYDNPSVMEDYSANFLRCSACGTMNRIGRSPGGGAYVPSSTVESTDAVTGKKFYADNASSQGCWACGCPDWATGGKLGDLRH